MQSGLYFFTAIVTAGSFALTPFLAGLTPAGETGGGFSVVLCSGNSITLDLGGDDKEPGPAPMHAKACHAVCCRDDAGDDGSSDADTDEEPED